MLTLKYIYELGLVLFFLIQLVNFLIRKYYAELISANIFAGLIMLIGLSLIWPVSLGIILFVPDIRQQTIWEFHFTKLFFTNLFLHGKK